MDLRRGVQHLGSLMDSVDCRKLTGKQDTGSLHDSLDLHAIN